MSIEPLSGRYFLIGTRGLRVVQGQEGTESAPLIASLSIVEEAARSQWQSGGRPGGF